MALSERKKLQQKSVAVAPHSSCSVVRAAAAGAVKHAVHGATT